MHIKERILVHLTSCVINIGYIRDYVFWYGLTMWKLIAV